MFHKAELISKALDKNLSAKEVWQPTQQLAEMAAEKIKANGIPAAIDKQPMTFSSLTNKEINAWYKNNSTTNYREISEVNTTYILEIESGASILSGDMLLEVRTKLIDPESGLVLGRNREWETADLPDTVATFKDNGRVYKETYLSIGQKLIKKSLEYFELINHE